VLFYIIRKSSISYTARVNELLCSSLTAVIESSKPPLLASFLFIDYAVSGNTFIVNEYSFPTHPAPISRSFKMFE
jgi:hypothetical protein